MILHYFLHFNPDFCGGPYAVCMPQAINSRNAVLPGVFSERENEFAIVFASYTCVEDLTGTLGGGGNIGSSLREAAARGQGFSGGTRHRSLSRRDIGRR